MSETSSQNENVPNEIDDAKIPLFALRERSRQILSLLNQTKVIPSTGGLPRDWRGVADLAGFRSEHGHSIKKEYDQMAKLLKIWNSQKYSQTATFYNLKHFLKEIDRFDVLDDVIKSLDEDAKLYLSGNKLPTNLRKEIIVDNSSDEDFLTDHDVYNIQQGLPLQEYDAFVLYDDSDINFAEELIKKMESYGFKLCVKERDLIAGISFEHKAVMRLISERCNRLIVIYSPEFLESNANTYLVNYAQSLGIEQGKRKILPCLYKYCVLPSTISHIWHLDYERISRFTNFWDKLKTSIEKTSSISIQRVRAITEPPACLTEISSNESVNTVSNYCKGAESLTTTTPIGIPRKNSQNINIGYSLPITFQNNSKSLTEETDFEMANGHIPLINETNNTTSCAGKSKPTRKWMNFRRWLPSKLKTSHEKPDGYTEKEKSKKKIRRQKLLSAQI